MIFGCPFCACVARGEDAQDIAGVCVEVRFEVRVEVRVEPIARPDAVAATCQSVAEKARAGLFETPEDLPNPV
jgi:hypothetical protein